MYCPLEKYPVRVNTHWGIGAKQPSRLVMLGPSGRGDPVAGGGTRARTDVSEQGQPLYTRNREQSSEDFSALFLTTKSVRGLRTSVT